MRPGMLHSEQVSLAKKLIAEWEEERDLEKARRKMLDAELTCRRAGILMSDLVFGQIVYSPDDYLKPMKIVFTPELAGVKSEHVCMKCGRGFKSQAALSGHGVNRCKGAP